MRRLLFTAAATTLAATALLGCGAIEKALDCANTAVVVAESVNDLQTAVSGAAENPAEAREALDRIDANLDKIDENTGDSDVSGAVTDLRTSVDEIRQSLDNGEVPDVSGAVSAADKLTNVCTPN
ncbi:hypothetical protein V1J52_07985 [Streptomyces sp. TRM 70351]|uniref:hypothetical protein n=1 Tax=Streptomyces sp. TRM 70351 TaxID=3116552 RepID=UPI002E7BA3E8|nr:hypothetical protein [Streptomyces sp. TRM 70351]MEE1928136.1 hypothetical protein [Streptomyces sp. TRM 70351]